MSLAQYKKKRSFNKTPEPAGKVVPTHKKLEFVIQKHHATQLHYDFRLELDGVLKSWAVPKGPSLDPSVKRLAMQVEDHPYEYRKFEGVIPEDNYGAGEVIIWDRGWYEFDPGPEPQPKGWPSSLEEGLSKGELKFILHGRKLKGSFALIKTKGMGDKAWLLIKHRDKFASTKDITKEDKSVVSGKKVEELQNKDSDLKQIDTSKAPKKSLTSQVSPMLATLTDAPFDGDDWLFEIKWDGYRALLAKQKDQIDLYSRSGQDFSKRYVDVVEGASRIKEDVLVDGEIVVVDKDGHGHFNWLQTWQKEKNGDLVYYVFDILWLNGRDLTALPLLERKKILQKTLPKSGPIIYSDHILKDGKKFFTLAEKQRLEGIMAKRISSTYQTLRRSKDWLKIKTHKRQEVVVGGFTDPKGSRKYVGSLLLGVYSRGQFQYVGHSGGSFGGVSLKDLRDQLDKLATDNNPFSDTPKEAVKFAHWVKPKLVCEVNFEEWTPDWRIRQPKIVGFRSDKKAQDVHREKALGVISVK